jgi:GNAT superfamily N-acetyltransferase
MGRNTADFHGITLGASNGDYDHWIFAEHPEHGEVGRMNWENANSKRPGRVAELWVDPEHRRKGIATAMWNFANKLHAEGTLNSAPVHSEDRTDKGDAFAKSVGGALPARAEGSIREGLEAEPFTPKGPRRISKSGGV